MIRLARDPELREQMGQNALRRLERDYLDWESKTDRVLEIVREVVHARQPQVAEENVEIEVFPPALNIDLGSPDDQTAPRERDPSESISEMVTR